MVRLEQEQNGSTKGGGSERRIYVHRYVGMHMMPRLYYLLLLPERTTFKYHLFADIVGTMATCKTA